MNADEPFEELLERSSLGHCWIECPTHGHQPIDPFEPGDVCLQCVIARGVVSHDKKEPQ